MADLNVPYRNDDSIMCRICRLEQEDTITPLIKPCNCNGTMGFVHVSCLQNWIATSSRLSCEVCKHRYRGRKKYKYGVVASILPYVKARWHEPKINFSLLILLDMIEQLLTEMRDFYYRSKKYEQNILKYRLFSSVLFRWLNYLMYPQTVVFMLLAFRDWSAWRQRQIVFMLDRRHSKCSSKA